MCSNECCRGGTTRSFPTCAPATRCWSPRTATRCAALVKHLDGLTPEAVVALNLPTGEPIVYDLDDHMQPTAGVGPGGIKGRYLDPDRALAAAEAVKRQTG